MNDKWFTEKNESFFRTNTTSFDNDEIISYNTIMRETSHRSNIFLCDINLCCCTIFGSTSFSFSHSIYFFINFSSMEITILTSSSNSPCNTRWMPSTNTSYFSVTSMWFFLKMSNTPSRNNTFKSLTFSNTNNINKLILIKNLIDTNFLLEMFVSKSNFFSNIFSSINLDLENIVFLLSKMFH